MRCLKQITAMAVAVDASSLPVLAQNLTLDRPGKPEIQDATRAEGGFYPPVFWVNHINQNFIHCTFSSVQPGVIQLSQSPAETGGLLP